MPARPTMKAAVLRGARNLTIEEVPVPEPGPGELLLRVETIGICGTDVSEYGSGPKLYPIETRHPVTGHLGPMIPGHEFSGRVAAIGPGAEGFSLDGLVAGTGSFMCGTCRYCVSGRSSRCVEHWAVGLHRDGAMAEYCVVPALSCLPVDDLGLTPDTAALAQPMSIAVHATRRGRIANGETVTVIGVGGAGAFVTYAAASAGCRVLAVDLQRDRLDIATGLGAAEAFPAGVDLSGTDADVVFEISGSLEGWDTARSAMGPRSRLVAVGFQKRPHSLDLAALTLNEQELIGTNAIDPLLDLPEAIRLLAGREAPWSDVAPMVRPMEDIADALNAIVEGATTPIKTLLSPRIDHERAFETTPR